MLLHHHIIPYCWIFFNIIFTNILNNKLKKKEKRIITDKYKIKWIFNHYYTGKKKVSGRAGSNRSFAHITVISFSVAERFSMLCV